MEKNKPVDGAFLIAASPGVVALFQVNKYFATHKEYISAVVPGPRSTPGLWRMVSCSSRLHTYAKYDNIAALNAATADLPADKVGNNSGLLLNIN